MESVKVEAIVQPNGRLILENLPFGEGEKVEVVVREADAKAADESANPLKGTLLKYDDPFDPAASPEDWEVLG